MLLSSTLRLFYIYRIRFLSCHQDAPDGPDAELLHDGTSKLQDTKIFLLMLSTLVLPKELVKFLLESGVDHTMIPSGIASSS